MHMKYPRTVSGDDHVRGMFVLVVEISEKIYKSASIMPCG